VIASRTIQSLLAASASPRGSGHRRRSYPA
jgi:hypothetical protein